MSSVRARSTSIPVRSKTRSTGSPHTLCRSLRLLKPATDGVSTRIMPAGTPRRWSSTHRYRLLAS